MSLDFVSVTVVSPLSGEVAWGPGLIEAHCTAGELCCRIFRETDARPRNACPNLLRGDVQLESRDKVCDKIVDVGQHLDADIQCIVLLHVVWSPAKWPMPAIILRLLLEPFLEPHLEKPPRWKLLRSASTRHICGFARGFLKNVDQDQDKGSKYCLLLEMLGLPERSFQALPDAWRLRLRRLAEGAATVEDKNEASLAAMVQSICDLAADPNNAKQFGVSCREDPRKLKEWPTRRDLRKAVALLVAAELWEDFGTSECGIRTDDVIQAAHGLFSGMPDFAQIRRSMLELNILKQRSISPSNFELDAERAQTCLEDVLGLNKTDIR